MALLQRPFVLFGAVVASVVCGCTSFVGAEDASDEASGGLTDPSDGSTAGSGTPDPTAASASASASGSGVSTSTTTGPSSATTDASASAATTLDETTSGGNTTATTGGSGSEAETGPDDSTSSSTSTSEGSSSSSTSTGSDPADLLGMECAKDGECAVDADQECCTAAQCLNTCMVPCQAVEECPEVGMGCEHGYCLFPCNNNDADCSAWPGYVCDHGGEFCEND